MWMLKAYTYFLTNVEQVHMELRKPMFQNQKA